MYIHKNKNLTSNARELRKNMTIQERHLWYEFLRNYPFKVHRQFVIENYIADFYCDAAKLVIEVDGMQHRNDEIYEYDEKRTRTFARYGIEVIRFSNRDIDENFEAVCRVIDERIKERV